MEVSATIIETPAPFCDRLLVILTTWLNFLKMAVLLFWAPDFETTSNVNSKPLELKLGVLGPFPCWSVLGQFNCPKYVLL
jgi:hypothetical protein